MYRGKQHLDTGQRSEECMALSETQCTDEMCSFMLLKVNLNTVSWAVFACNVFIYHLIVL